MTTEHPSGVEGGNVWIQDITTLEPTETPWLCYPFDSAEVAARVVRQSHDLTFAEFDGLFEALP